MHACGWMCECVGGRGWGWGGRGGAAVEGMVSRAPMGSGLSPLGLRAVAGLQARHAGRQARDHVEPHSLARQPWAPKLARYASAQGRCCAPTTWHQPGGRPFYNSGQCSVAALRCAVVAGMLLSPAWQTRRPPRTASCWSRGWPARVGARLGAAAMVGRRVACDPSDLIKPTSPLGALFLS